MNQAKKIIPTGNDANILYYDAIAVEYDGQLNSDERNFQIREIVATKFLNEVKGLLVLDFGGGTGQDFRWLLEHQYQITFCEPSRAMRQIARERKEAEFPESNVFFFDDAQADFRNWTEKFPVEQKMDAVLANFAVINCIRDIDGLFDKLAMALKQGGQVIALILDDHFMTRLRTNPGGAIRSFISGRPVKLFVNHNNHRQEVYVHTIRSVRNACRVNFHLVSQIRLSGYGFRLIHLMRK